MELSAQERQRYARHLLLTEVGPEGQALLCAARFAVPPGADPRAAAVARTYLERAGVHEGAGGRPVPLPDAAEVRRRAGGEPLLEDAAAAVLGSHGAVEVIKAVLGAGRPGVLPPELGLGPRD